MILADFLRNPRVPRVVLLLTRWEGLAWTRTVGLWSQDRDLRTEPSVMP
jgi:hypothetical protein